MALLIEDTDESNEAHLLHEVARQLRTSFDRRAQHLGLTRSQWRVLGVLRRNPGIRQTVLADHLEVEPITLGRLLDRMVKAGWVERRPDPDDRRANQVFLTAKAGGILKKMRGIALTMRQDALRGFSEKEHAALLSYLKRIKANIGMGDTA